MSVTFLTLTLNRETCCSCGVVFGIEANHQAELRRSHEGFYCPNGHRQYYLVENDAEREKKAREKAESNARWWQDRAESNQRQADGVRYQLRATKGVVTRIRRRIGKGVCPCCNRTFADLSRHMDNKHPEFATEPA